MIRMVLGLAGVLLSGVVVIGVGVWIIGTTGRVDHLRDERIGSVSPLFVRLLWIVPLGAVCGAASAILILVIAAASGAPEYSPLSSMGSVDVIEHGMMGLLVGGIMTAAVYGAWLHGLKGPALRRIILQALTATVVGGALGAEVGGPGLGFFAAVLTFGLVCWLAALRAWRGTRA